MNQSVVITFLCKPVNLSQVTRFGAPEHCCIKARFFRANSRQRCWLLVRGQVPGLDVSVSLGTSCRLCRPQSGAGGNAPAVCAISWVEKTPSCSPHLSSVLLRAADGCKNPICSWGCLFKRSPSRSPSSHGFGALRRPTALHSSSGGQEHPRWEHGTWASSREVTPVAAHRCHPLGAPNKGCWTQPSGGRRN